MVHDQWFKFDVKGQVQGYFRQKSTKMVYTNPQLNDFNNFGVLPLLQF